MLGLILLIAIVTIQVAFLLWLPWHVAALLLFLYTLRWIDRNEHTGHGSWAAWRSAWWWRWQVISPVADVVGSVVQPPKCIYLITPCTSTSTLLWGIGLGAHTLLFWTMPFYYFWVPGVRDILIWSGAVSHSEGNIAALLANGRGICYALVGGGGGGGDYDSSEDEVYTQLPSDWLLEMAIREQLRMQIVTVQNDNSSSSSNSSSCRRQRICIYYGTKIEASVYPDVVALKAAIGAAIVRNSITALGDKIIKSQ